MDISTFKSELQSVLKHTSDELAKIRSNRVDPAMIYGIRVTAYGAESNIRNVANVFVNDAKTLVIQPWDKSLISQIYKDIQASDLGASYSQEGDKIRMVFPDLTEERRKEIVKLMNKSIEESRISIRSVRQKYMKDIDDGKKTGLSEDSARRMQEEGESAVKDANGQLEEMRENKEKELMTV